MEWEVLMIHKEKLLDSQHLEFWNYHINIGSGKNHQWMLSLMRIR